MGWEKIIDIVSWLKDKLPIPNRIEGIKNEITRLEREENGILIDKAEVKNARRMQYIHSRLIYLRRLLEANSKDD